MRGRGEHGRRKAPSHRGRERTFPSLLHGRKRLGFRAPPEIRPPPILPNPPPPPGKITPSPCATGTRSGTPHRCGTFLRSHLLFHIRTAHGTPFPNVSRPDVAGKHALRCAPTGNRQAYARTAAAPQSHQSGKAAGAFAVLPSDAEEDHGLPAHAQGITGTPTSRTLMHIRRRGQGDPHRSGRRWDPGAAQNIRPPRCWRPL